MLQVGWNEVAMGAGDCEHQGRELRFGDEKLPRER